MYIFNMEKNYKAILFYADFIVGNRGIYMNIFKAYDIRGIYKEELDEELAYKIARAFVKFTDTKQVLIGRDARIGSENIYPHIAKGLTDAGADVIDIDLCTTPMFNFVQAHHKYEAGMMVTASHNPKEYTGAKLNTVDAMPLTGETGIKDIEEMTKGDFPETEAKGTVEEKDFLDEYVNYMIKLAKGTGKLKIVVDASNGFAGIITKKVFEGTDSEIIPLNFKPDGNFPGHDPNPLKGDSQTQTKEKVVAEKADFGCLFDADADRIIFVDEKGETVQPDFIAAAVSELSLKENPGDKILFDCISSRIIKKTIEDNGGVALVTRVGRSFIYSTAKEKDVVFGAEASSHYYHREVYHSDNGLLTLLKMMRIVTQNNKPLSEVIAPYAIYAHSGEVNIKVEDKEKSIDAVKEKFSDGKQSFIDGVSVEYGDVWFNVRQSNTEPILRIRLEGTNKDFVNDMKEKILGLLKERGLYEE